MPLAFMLKVMRDEAEPKERRIEMAIAAAPFCHPRLNAIAVATQQHRAVGDRNSHP
jgi:hypothetical protein